MADFISTFQSFEENFRSAIGGAMGKIDQITFKMLINNLKSTDYQSVVDTLDQLGKEKRPVSIPPIYFLSVAHPDNRIRTKAATVLNLIDPKGEVPKLVADKGSEEAVRALIQKYGNFKG